MLEARVPASFRSSLAGQPGDFESIVDLAADAFLVLGPSGETIYLNRSFEELWGLSRESDPQRAVETLAARLVEPETFLARLNTDLSKYEDAGERLFLHDGRIVHGLPWPLVRDGVVAGQVWNFRDITDRISESLANSAALLDKERRFRSLVENASDLITVVDLASTILYQSPSSERFLGYAAEELIGKKLTELLHPEDKGRILAFLEDAAGAGESDYVNVRLMHAKDAWVHVEIQATDRRVDPEIGGVVLNSRDVTARHLLEQELQYQAHHDPLTGLLNRRGFTLQLQAALTDAVPGALLMFDLDDFKDVNDSLGHAAGDRVLQQLANLLRQEFGDTATISRLGGDEFAILIRDVTPARATATSRQVLSVLRGHTFEAADGEIVDLTTSMGIVAFPRDGSTVEELMSRVDLALYEAKAKGRNRISGFAGLGDLEAKAEARLKMRHEIRGAIKEDRLMLYSQPIIGLKREQVAHHELLLRMKQENGRVLRAKSFINLAERTGLIVPIDRWVLLKALSLLAERAADGDTSVLAINLSAKAFADREATAWVEAQLNAKCADPSKLIIEVSETAAISDIDNAERFMHCLKSLGCRFALDDFGVGFSSFQRLRRLPVDFLKIDGSFIRAIGRGVEDLALVESIVAIAGALHMETIAESVETAQQLAILQQLGVDFAQGYYVGRPRPLQKSVSDKRRLPSAA